MERRRNGACPLSFIPLKNRLPHHTATQRLILPKKDVMTWKQFVRRFNEMMANTSTTPLGVTNLEAWREQQKIITEQHLREEQEKRELVEHWFEQDTYINDSRLKRAWMRVQYIFLDLRGETRMPQIPDHMIIEVARCLLPDIIAFYETEEGREAFRKWKEQQMLQEETEKRKAS